MNERSTAQDGQPMEQSERSTTGDGQPMEQNDRSRAQDGQRMGQNERTPERDEPVMPGIGRSVILRVVGVGFALLGLAWTRAFIGSVAAGGPASFEDWRAGAYALTYLLAGVGMVLHTRWAAFAAAAWGLVTLTQFFYPPIPRSQVPLLAQVAVGLIVIFWTVGLVFYIRRHTRSAAHNGGG